MHIQKIRTQILMTPELYNHLNRYGESHQCRSMSEVIERIIGEWKRTKAIVFELEEKQRAKDYEKAKVIKE